MSLLLPDGLLVLSLLFVRPVPDTEWPRRLVLHGLLLSGCLVASAVAGWSAGAGEARCLAALAASLLRLAVPVLLVRRIVAGMPFRPGPDEAAWLLAGLALVALAIRITPDSGAPHGLLTVCVAATLAGLSGTLAARSAVGRIGSLLLIGDVLILAACCLPGTDVLALCTILLFQAASLGALVRAAAGTAVS